MSPFSRHVLSRLNDPAIDEMMKELEREFRLSQEAAGAVLDTFFPDPPDVKELAESLAQAYPNSVPIAPLSPDPPKTSIGKDVKVIIHRTGIPPYPLMPPGPPTPPGFQPGTETHPPCASCDALKTKSCWRHR